MPEALYHFTMYMEELDQLAPAGRSCMPIVVTAEWLGHAGPTFTMRTYVHSQDDALKRAAETWQRVVTPS